MKKSVNARWRSWIAVDSGRPDGADPRETELDALLRRGAGQCAQSGEGKMRWRVLSAISAQKPAVQGHGGIIARIGWRSGALAACALIAVGVGAVWLGPSAPQSASVAPGTGNATEPAQATPAAGRGARLSGLAFLQSPMTALVAQIDQPFEREADRLMTDAKKMAAFFAERVTAPIAALHRSGTSRQERAPTPDDLHSGGA